MTTPTTPTTPTTTSTEDTAAHIQEIEMAWLHLTCHLTDAQKRLTELHTATGPSLSLEQSGELAMLSDQLDELSRRISIAASQAVESDRAAHGVTE